MRCRTTDNGYSQYDGLIAVTSSALGDTGLVHLKQLVEELGKTPAPAPPKKR